MLGDSLYKPFEDQLKSIEKICQKLALDHKRTLFVGATGSGKTVIFSELNRRLFTQKILTSVKRRLPRIMFVVHRDNLITNTLHTLLEAGFKEEHIGIVAGMYKENRHAPIQIVTVQTVSGSRYFGWFDWDIAIFDEGHITGFSRWGRQLEKENKKKPIVYLTATPWREKKSESFTQLVPEDHWVFAPLPSELMKMGRLVPRCRYYKEVAINTEGIKTVMGDFAVKELSIASKDVDVITKGLAFWDEHAMDKKTGKREAVGVFCVDVSHAEFVYHIAKEWGRKAAIVTAKTEIAKDKKNPPEGTREWIYRELELNREVDMLISVDCISEGFDVKSLRCGWGLRPTKSASKFYQQLGRILRACKGKEFSIFLDQADNILYEDRKGNKKGRFLPVEDLEHDHFYDVLNLNKGDAPPPRLCVERDPWTWEIPENPKGCGEIVGAKEKVCPYCGYVLPVRLKRKAEESEIIEVKEEQLLPKGKCDFNEEKFQNFFKKVMNDCYRLRYSPGYAWYKCRDEFHTNIPKDYYYRWVVYRDKLANARLDPSLRVTQEDIDEWLIDVDTRKGEEGELYDKWRYRFDPPNTDRESLADKIRREKEEKAMAEAPPALPPSPPKTVFEAWDTVGSHLAFVKEHATIASYDGYTIKLACDKFLVDFPLFKTTLQKLVDYFNVEMQRPVRLEILPLNEHAKDLVEKALRG